LLSVTNYNNYLGFSVKLEFLFNTFFFCLDTEKESKRNQEQTIAIALCFFLYGQPFHLAALKKHSPESAPRLFIAKLG
jgi:hypothetical protein